LLGALLRDEQGRAPSGAELVDQAVTLADWHLIGWDGQAETVSLHPLLKQYFAGRAAPDQAAEIHRRMSDWYGGQPIAASAATLEGVKPRVLAVEHALRAGDAARCQELFFAPLTPLYSFVDWLRAFGHLATAAALLGAAAGASTGRRRAQFLIARSAMSRNLGSFEPALKDLDEAVALLEAPGTERSAEERASLAGALSNRGNVCRQLARYDQARADLDRAVAELEALAAADDGRRLQLAKMLLNRSILWRETGRLRRAVEDCTAAIRLHQAHLPPLLQSIDPDLASAFLNRGNIHADLYESEPALHDHEEAMAIYSRLLRIGQGEFGWGLANARQARATVLISIGRHAEALAELDEAVTVLDELAQAGRQDLEASLGLGLMNRATALAGLGRFPEALKENEAAVSLFRRLTRADWDTEGLLAHALLSGAVLRYRAGDLSGAEHCRQEGMEFSKRLMLQGEREILTVFVRHSVEAGLTLLAGDSAAGAALMSGALAVAEQALAAPDPSEALAAAVRHLLPRVEARQFLLEPSGFDLQILARLRKLLLTE
jgi:tetratricopeptide (TPR) repeat protein